MAARGPGTFAPVELADLDYDLPTAAIAQEPVEPRDAARLLVDRGPGAQPDDLSVADLPGLLGPGDLVVVNRTRVFPARVQARKPTGGRVEVLFVERAGEHWTALVRPGGRVRPGTTLQVEGSEVELVVGGSDDDGRTRHVTIGGATASDDTAVLDEIGRLALPPYLTGDLADPERYQTVFGDRVGSVAAPTAGLHLTPALLAGIRAAGAELRSVELQVGLGTFLPVTADHLDDHVMHAERFEVEAGLLDECAAADRVVAVGTTSVRALEAAARGHDGSTDLFIRPGFDFRVVDALLTNFHQPRSTLLALLAAFVGPRWRDLYAHALERGYRFLSLGDAMFLPERTA